MSQVLDVPVRPRPVAFAQRALTLTSSAIREILKVTERPDVISFAGGLPSPDLFPVDEVRAAFDRVLSRAGRSALQYGPTPGHTPLRAWVAGHLTARGRATSVEEVLIVSGSQQGLDLLGKVLIDPGSTVLVEAPSYLGALQCFGLYQPRFATVPTDDEGVIPAGLDAPLARGARFLYVLPNFQNPTGRTLATGRRRALLEQAARQGVPVIEDDPYGDLRHAGQAPPTLYALAADGDASVVRLGSFSKVLAPGLRLGYVAAPRAVIDKLVQAKQATDLHTSTLTQMAVLEVIEDGFLDRHLPAVQALYRRQCAVMLEALARHCPEGARWTRPEGGMFIWVTLPGAADAAGLLRRAIAAGVAFVPGAPFYAERPVPGTLRLCFATVPGEQIREGIARLGRLLHEA